ncbi:MAG: hypothetical protein ABFC86_02380, partial [Rectinema sp.]
FSLEVWRVWSPPFYPGLNPFSLGQEPAISRRRFPAIYHRRRHVGTFLGEIISVAIPNQRIDRVVDFIKKLSEKYSSIEEKCINNSEAIFLIEEGIRISSKTNNSKKREWISSIIGKGIYKEIEPNVTEKFISILEEITNEQVIILLYFSLKNEPASYDMRSIIESKYSEIVMPPSYIISDRDRRSFCESNYSFNISFLERCSLIKKTISVQKNIEYSLPSVYKKRDIEHIIEEYRKDIFEKIEKAINKDDYKISSLGINFIENISFGKDDIENSI